MAFLTINGYDVPIANGQASLNYQKLGRQSRSYQGVLSGTYRARVREWTLQTDIMDEANIEALVGLIDGTGHTWTFDNDLFSSKGLGPNSGYSVTVSTTGGKVGGFMTVATTTNIGWNTFGVNVPYTVMVWKKDLGGNWQHYAINTTGDQFKNGASHTPVAGDNITHWFAYSAGSITLVGKEIDGTNGAAHYDELVAVPYIMPLAQITAAYNENVAGRGHSLLPAINITGDCVSTTYSGPVPMIGNVGNNTFIQAQYGASFQSNLRRVNFTLSEIEDVEQTS